MMMSDGDARNNQVRADKLKYAVEMNKKGFNIDVNGLLGPEEKHKQRKKPKIVVVGIQKKLTIAIFMLFGFFINLAIFGVFYSDLKTSLNSINKFHKDSMGLVDIYSSFIEVTNRINYSGIYNLEEI